MPQTHVNNIGVGTGVVFSRVSSINKRASVCDLSVLQHTNEGTNMNDAFRE